MSIVDGGVCGTTSRKRSSSVPGWSYSDGYGVPLTRSKASAASRSFLTLTPTKRDAVVGGVGGDLVEERRLGAARARTSRPRS